MLALFLAAAIVDQAGRIAVRVGKDVGALLVDVAAVRAGRGKARCSSNDKGGRSRGREDGVSHSGLLRGWLASSRRNRVRFSRRVRTIAATGYLEDPYRQGFIPGLARTWDGGKSGVRGVIEKR